MAISTSQPLVSILIAAYNPGEYLRATLQSCLDQDYPNTEILVRDDCSKEDVSRYIPKNDGRIRLIRSEENLWPFWSLNRLLDIANGKYIAIQDHDDIWHPEKISRQVEFLEKNQQYVGCGTSTIMYYEEDQKYFEYYLGETNYYTIHPSLAFRNNPNFRYDISWGWYFADAVFMKDVLCNWEKKIFNLWEALTLHLIKEANGNYSYSWYRFSFSNIKRAYQLHPVGYATLTIGWELMRKLVYPLLGCSGQSKWITEIERIPFRLMGKKIQQANGTLFEKFFPYLIKQ